MYTLYKFLPIILSYFNPCISILRLNPSIITSASIPVADLDQFIEQTCFGIGSFLFDAL